jgi:hypothetical protein
MQQATPATVLGDFAAAPLSFAGETTSFRRDGDRFLLTSEGLDGAPHELPVRYTFGVWPLQQLLVPGDRGRLHSPLVSWDSRDAATGGQRWFRLRPEDGGSRRATCSTPSARTSGGTDVRGVPLDGHPQEL